VRRSSRVKPRPAPQQPAPPRQRQAASSPLPALLLVAKFAWPLIPLALYAAGSDEPTSPELTASDKRQAEEQLMTRIATAGPEIERRLARWLTARDGLLFLREPVDATEPYSFHVLPALAPWRASCGELGLTVTVATFRKDLTEIALVERQCDELLTVLGRAMRSLTTTEDRPAQQPRKDRP
jgi:hypothetical protein